MRKLGRILLYGTLATGAAVFSFPFLWMAATSVKVDREIQTKDFRLMPMTPRARTVSPYVDPVRYADIEGPYQAELLPALEELADKSGFRPPARVNAAIARREIARGLYDKMRRRLPTTLWEGESPPAAPGGDTHRSSNQPQNAEDPISALTSAATKDITPEMVSECFDNVYRRLCIGPIRLRSYDRVECELGKPAEGKPAPPLSKRLENLSPETLSLSDVTDKGEPFLLLGYDLTKADSFTLTGTFDVPPALDLGRLHRVFVDIRPDDTWHELWLTMEKGGRRYRSRRAWPLANYDVTAATWQEPGPDDDSTKIKTWILMEPVASDGPVLAEPHRIKLTFEFRRSGAAGAWWNKIALNYQKVFDHIPFWRYLRVSLFLVIANITLTLLVSSLVAYAFSRLTWPGRDLCFVLMLATMMIPFQVIMIPQFLIWKNIGAYNTLTPLWLAPAFGSAFFIFLMRQFLKGIPRDLEDAARIDGCGFLRIYWHIMLPLIKPSLAAIAIFTFLGAWNDFMGPLIYIADQRLYPLAFGLYAFAVQVSNSPALTMAGSLLMTVPVIVIFFFAQKYFIQGVTLTGIKG